MKTAHETKTKQAEVQGYPEILAATRSLPDGEAIIRDNFLDEDIHVALERFWTSDEWKNTLSVLNPRPGDWVLDYGAGRCLAAVSFVRLGCRVVAVDINPSKTVGIGVLTQYDVLSHEHLHGILGDLEHSMFRPQTFDIVYCREALHHAFNLEKLTRNLVGALKPGGRFYAYGDHRHPWWSSDAKFRKLHPAVRFGVNEHSYLESTYRRRLKKAGLRQVVISQLVPTLYAQGIAPWHHRMMGQLSRLPVAGKVLYQHYVRLKMYNAVGSQIIIFGRK